MHIELPPPLQIVLPADFASRAANTRERLDAGEDLTFDQLAAALGLPAEFIASAAAIAAVLQSGRPVILRPAPPSTSH